MLTSLYLCDLYALHNFQIKFNISEWIFHSNLPQNVEWGAAKKNFFFSFLSRIDLIFLHKLSDDDTISISISLHYNVLHSLLTRFPICTARKEKKNSVNNLLNKFLFFSCTDSEVKNVVFVQEEEENTQWFDTIRNECEPTICMCVHEWKFLVSRLQYKCTPHAHGHTIWVCMNSFFYHRPYCVCMPCVRVSVYVFE